jgi:hypothetical protein
LGGRDIGDERRMVECMFEWMNAVGLSSAGDGSRQRIGFQAAKEHATFHLRDSIGKG